MMWVRPVVLKNTRLVLVGDSFIMAVYGIILLASLRMSPPLLMRLIENMLANPPSGKTLLFQPGVRPVLTIITPVLGIGLLLECGVQVVLAFTLSVEQVILLSPIVRYGMWGAFLLWAIFFSRRRRRRRSRMLEDVSNQPIHEPTTIQSSHKDHYSIFP